jgi:hypothetical protein
LKESILGEHGREARELIAGAERNRERVDIDVRCLPAAPIDFALLYVGVKARTKPRCHVGNVRPAEIVCVSFVPPKPPATSTPRVYSRLNEPI